MPRNSPDFTLEEISGNQYPDLATAQRSTLKATAADLAATIRALLTSGILVQHNGRIIPNYNRK